MIDVHRAAHQLEPSSLMGTDCLPSGMFPVGYETIDADGRDIEFTLSGNYVNIRPDKGDGVILWLELDHGEKNMEVYDIARNVWGDSSYEWTEQVEDEMIELFNNIVEAFERGSSARQIVDYYGFEKL